MKGAAGRDLKYDPPTSNTGWEMQRDETPAKKKVECWLENRQEWASRVRAHEGSWLYQGKSSLLGRLICCCVVTVHLLNAEAHAPCLFHSLSCRLRQQDKPAWIQCPCGRRPTKQCLPITHGQLSRVNCYYRRKSFPLSNCLFEVKWKAKRRRKCFLL